MEKSYSQASLKIDLKPLRLSSDHFLSSRKKMKISTNEDLPFTQLKERKKDFQSMNKPPILPPNTK